MLPFKEKLKELREKLRKNQLMQNLSDGKISERTYQGYELLRETPWRYIVNFYCPASKLIIEWMAASMIRKERMKRDEIRDHYLGGLGLPF